MQFMLAFSFGVCILLDAVFSIASPRTSKRMRTVYMVVIVVTLVAGAYAFTGVHQVVDQNPYVTHEVVSLRDGYQVHGRVRRVDESLYCTYAYKTASGGIKFQSADCKNVEVFLTDDCKPRAEWYYMRYDSHLLRGSRFAICRIYLPAGSVVEDFIIDLE